MTRQPPLSRRDFRCFSRFQTRINDNDEYGHLYNVKYLELFDNAINGWMMRNGMQNLRGSDPVAVVAESRCSFLHALAFPDEIDIGLRLDRLGNSSLAFALAMFRHDRDQAAAQANVTMVFVKPGTHDPVRPPQHFRDRLETLLVV